MSNFTEAKMRHRDLRHELSDLEREMAEIVDNFQGTLQEALQQGMVKYDFPKPKYWISREDKIRNRKM